MSDAAVLDYISIDLHVVYVSKRFKEGLKEFDE